MLSSGTGFPRNAICAACYEGAKAIIGFLNKDEQEDDHGSVNSRVSSKLNGSTKVELVCSLLLNGSCSPTTRHYDACRSAFRIHNAALPFVARANGSMQKARSPPEDSLAVRASRPRKP